MNKAVFLDRDGVINSLVYYPDWAEYESPRGLEDFKIYPYVPMALRAIKDAGFYIFVISNQPSYAKGKTSMANINAISKRLQNFSKENGNLIDRHYYCFHHPDAVIPEYAVECRCRKPGTLFPEQAVKEFSLDTKSCYFIGDQDSDMFCGKSMGFKTIKIDNLYSTNKSGKSNPDYHVVNLLQAASLIRQEEKILYGMRHIY